MPPGRQFVNCTCCEKKDPSGVRRSQRGWEPVLHAKQRAAARRWGAMQGWPGRLPAGRLAVRGSNTHPVRAPSRLALPTRPHTFRGLKMRRPSENTAVAEKADEAPAPIARQW